MANENAGAPRAMIGGNGHVEIRQMNAVQGWHSGYLTPSQARKLAIEITALADQLEDQANASR